MKVDHPKFDSSTMPGTVMCGECPLDDHEDLCNAWGSNHKKCCPTADTYAEACKLAEGAV